MHKRHVTALALLALLAASPGHSEEPKSLGKFGGWEAYAYPEGGGKVCYAAARSDHPQGGDKGRAGTAIAITHRAKSPGEVSLIAPYGFKKDSDAEIQIGGMKHAFFTKGTSAWAKDTKADPSILAAMAKGKEVSIRATPAKGAAISDSVSLKGFAEALAAIDKACGVKR